MNTLNVKIKHQAKRAFTLIEIMVATVIMVVLVGLVIQITSEVLKVWSRSSGKLSANAEARVAMDIITQDLETAVFRNNGKQWLRVEAPLDPGGPFTDQTVALKLFSPALDRDQSVPGDICAIGYELNFGPAYNGATDSVYALYRKIVDPKTTFDQLMGSGDDPAQDTLTGGEWATIVDEPDRSNYLAGNILEFKVLLYVDDGTGTAKLENADPTTLELKTGKDGNVVYGQNPNNPDDTAVEIIDDLLYADILLTVISDEGLKLLQVVGKIPESAAEVVQQHGDTFTRRVNFMAHPL
jgi:prepilin-type N-terminal cleavage/methylation domain-containing protein